MRPKRIIPRQTEGNYSGAESTVKATNIAEAMRLFSLAKKRLLDINNWDKYSGHAATAFLHLDAKGRRVTRKP
ncbi:MAG TPA: hypothetical protein VD905_18805, partial [Flavobacteriales bacterium]|nr:hypothetical protein [Flavobacteriales bacterium]